MARFFHLLKNSTYKQKKRQNRTKKGPRMDVAKLMTGKAVDKAFTFSNDTRKHRAEYHVVQRTMSAIRTHAAPTPVTYWSTIETWFLETSGFGRTKRPFRCNIAETWPNFRPPIWLPKPFEKCVQENKTGSSRYTRWHKCNASQT